MSKKFEEQDSLLE
ncbi:hypothetical protein LINPERPRIM_LOCUS24472 [Linum perenne]